MVNVIRGVLTYMKHTPKGEERSKRKAAEKGMTGEEKREAAGAKEAWERVVREAIQKRRRREEEEDARATEEAEKEREAAEKRRRDDMEGTAADRVKRHRRNREKEQPQYSQTKRRGKRGEGAGGGKRRRGTVEGEKGRVAGTGGVAEVEGAERAAETRKIPIVGEGVERWLKRDRDWRGAAWAKQERRKRERQERQNGEERREERRRKRGRTAGSGGAQDAPT